MSGCLERFPLAPESKNQKIMKTQMFSNISGWLANGQEQEAALASGASWTGTKPTSIERISGKNLLAETRSKSVSAWPDDQRLWVFYEWLMSDS